MTQTAKYVHLVTSWGNACGIAEHSALLKAAVQKADPTITVEPDAQSLDPEWCLGYLGSRVSQGWKLVLHLNHHDALHSRWTPEKVREVRAMGIPVVVTYHDTREHIAQTPKLGELVGVADALILHEPVEGVRGPNLHYWRQGVPAPAQTPYWYYSRTDQTILDASMRRIAFKAFPQQPVLGTVGFNFPWKNYDRLCALTAEAGWALVLLANNATAADIMKWEKINPDIMVMAKFLPQAEVINYLAQCDATIFMYECANTGTSGAIRQGIAARKPVIALQTCRQFRDLFLLESDPQFPGAIHWVKDWTEAATALTTIERTPFDPLMMALAHRESWQRYGEKHADLYRQLLEARA